MFCKRGIYPGDRKALIFFLLVFSIRFSLFGQIEDNDEEVTVGIEKLNSMESWLLYEKGLHSFELKDYGESLSYFNKLVERHGVYPEAEYWIGRIFEQEGEFILAEQQYLKALEAERVLLIPREKYEIKYRLVELYKNRGNYDLYKHLLNGIVLDELKENQIALENERIAINTLKKDGIDKMLLLFRHKFTYSIDSFNQLGVYYYKTGDYKAATSKLIYPLLSLFSIAIEYLRSNNPEFIYPETIKDLLEDQPEYVFNTLERVIQRDNENFSFNRDIFTTEISDKENQYRTAILLIPEHPEYYLSGASFCLNIFEKDPALKKLVEDYNIYKTLYYLGASLYAEGYSETAAEIWEIINNSLYSGMWGRKAYKQLINPVVEIGLSIF